MLNNLQEIKSYTPPKLTRGKNNWYISFYAYNPETEKLQRKVIRLNHVKTNRLQYANELLKRLSNNLATGWNPWTEKESNKTYVRLSKAIDHFILIAEKKLNDNVIRQETLKDYISYLRNFQNWIEGKNWGDIYIYKIDKKLITLFLEHIYIERNRTVQTRNNYLKYLSVFCGFLVENDYLKSKPTDGIRTLKKGVKQREVISEDNLKKIFDYLKDKNKFYLLACYILYYCFIRPRELSLLKISDINFKTGIIVVQNIVAKNKKTQAVSIPVPLQNLMIELQLFSYKTDYFIFSQNFEPGKNKRSEKFFRDEWIKVRRKLKLPVSYKFYSLKDTGITNLLSITGNPLLVRDQARHSNIAITDIYTPHEMLKANKEILELDY